MSIGTLLGRNTLYEKFFVFFFLCGQRAIISELLAQFSNMVGKTVFDVSRGTLWGELFFFWRKNLCVFNMFGHWPKHFWPHGKTILSSVLFVFDSSFKTTLYLSWIAVGEKVCFSGKNRFCWRFRALIEKILDICRTFLDGIVKTDFYVIRRIFWV